MTNKSTSFKRIALALVAALGFGVLSTGSSQAYLSAATTTLALSSTTVSGAPGETVSVTATLDFNSTHAAESINVTMGTDNAVATELFRGLAADSVNVATGTGVGIYAGQPRFFNVFSSTAAADSSVVAHTTGMFVPSNASDGTVTAVKAKFSVVLQIATGAAAGNYTYTIVTRSVYGGTTTNLDVDTLTLTVTALDTTAVAAKSKLYVNQVMHPSNAVIESDSALVVSAGTVSNGAQTFTNVAGIHGVWMNASDTKTVGPVGATSSVSGTMTLNISGPGLLSNATNTYTTRAKSITLAAGETAAVWSDGTPGVGTITGYLGGLALTQAAKTITFFGPATTFTVSDTTVVTTGATALSSRAADSVIVGTKIVTFTAKDAASNSITSAALNKNGNIWCISSDTSVIGTGTGTAPNNYKAATPPTTGSTWSCDMVVRSAGTATITVADDTVVANATYSSTAKSVTTAAPINSTTKGIGTIAFDKTTYNIGEKAVITVTVKNSASAVPGQVTVGGDVYTQSHIFPTLVQNKAFSGIGYDSGGGALGFGTSRTGSTFDLSTGTFLNGVETYVVLMPTVAGDVTITGFTTDGTYDTATAVSVTLKVVDPNAALIAASQAATVAAAEAATDAAAEAIDAANAATDAANLAAEAADAATVAAEEARDAADAATAAVEELATQVATLMAALKAQITTLANTVAKIAKKVKA